MIKDDLLAQLQLARDALVWKLDGLTEHQVRTPMTPTGTNLLGLVKHCAMVEAGYFSVVFGRELPDSLRWLDELEEDNQDMYAAADESRDFIVETYRQVWALAGETIAALDVDAPGTVPWWSPEKRCVTLGVIMMHVTGDVQRHAGHADILAELIDGRFGWRLTSPSLPDWDGPDWETHRAKLKAIAEQFA